MLGDWRCNGSEENEKGNVKIIWSSHVAFSLALYLNSVQI
jgi:hypothetical protein